jgi:hypothetical protein
MIEVIETTTAAGTNAEVVGGKQAVTITAVAAKFHEARRSACDNRKIKAYTSPAGFWVKHKRGTKFATDYSEAVSLAVHHANRI